MSTEALQNQITPEQIFRESYSWLTEEHLTQNGLVVNRTIVPITGSAWYRDVLWVASRNYKAGRIDSEVILEVVNTYNHKKMPSDSQVVVLNPDKAETVLNLGLALAYAIVSCKKTPTLNTHYDKTTPATVENVNNFFNSAFGFKTPLEIELMRFAQKEGH